MTEPKALHLPDFSKALPPKNGRGLDIMPRRLLAYLKRRQGDALTTMEILKAMKETVAIWDNHAAVIDAACRLVEQGAVEKRDIQIDGRWLTAWIVPLPPEPKP